MKTLFIMRHAQSSWDSPNFSDFDRPLNHRGVKAAPYMARMMNLRKAVPDLILTSPARRAEQTAERVKQSGGFTAEIRADRRIYEADPATLLELIQEIEDDFNAVLLVGHNPGVEGLIKALTGLLRPMAPGALVGISLNAENWNEVASDAAGKLTFVIAPKEETSKM
jgi:phosphohistidine phosphatase